MVLSRSSASLDFSSMVPMKMKKGTASRTWLLITPKMRSGSASISVQSKKPSSTPMAAKSRAVPPRLKATG